MTFSGGASACNVFWQVGSSATIGSAAQFRGTVLAQQSITATTGATIVGRLLAQNGAVTLDTNTITVPRSCPAPGTPSETVAPTITSGTPTGATAGTPYSFTVAATGNPAPTFTVTAGTLPAGLTLDSDTGVISGTPTTPGADTPTAPAVPVDDRPRGTGPTGDLAYTGSESTGPLLVAGSALLAGIGLVTATALRRRRAARPVTGVDLHSRGVL